MQVDVNQDGLNDVVVGSTSAAFVPGQVLLGLSDGGFAGPYSLPHFGYSIVAITLPDGPALIATAGGLDDGGAGLDVLQGWSDGGFSSVRTIPTTIFLGGLAVGDFNGDGQPDVAAADDALIKVIIVISDGGFELHALDAGPPGALPATLHAGDLNSDGIDDLLWASYSSGQYVNHRKYLGTPGRC